MSQQALNDDSWTTLAKSLDVEAAALKAVATVEAAGSGFLPKDPTRPKILFEGHAFHRLTGGRFAEQAARPQLSEVGQDEVLGQLDGRMGSARSGLQPRSCRGAASRRAGACSRSWASTTRTAAAPTSRHSWRCSTPAPTSRWSASRASSLGRRTWRRCKRRTGSAFAKAYNGPQHAKNNYAPKMAAAYATVAAEPRAGAQAQAARASAVNRTASGVAAGPRDVRAGCRDAQAHGRANATCGPTPSTCATGSIGRAIAFAPPDELWSNARKVKQQGDTNACTGFSLATRARVPARAAHHGEASRRHLGIHALQHGAAL